MAYITGVKRQIYISAVCTYFFYIKILLNCDFVICLIMQIKVPIFLSVQICVIILCTCTLYRSILDNSFLKVCGCGTICFKQKCSINLKKKILEPNM